jgi:glutamine amidotransferase
MSRFNASGMRQRVEELVLGLRVSVLGVCVGMQMLADSSEEGSLPGLGWIPGRVRAFANAPQCNGLPMPHMGWNQVQSRGVGKLFHQGFDDVPEFYFLHSYYFDARDKADVAATAHYGFDFDAVVSRGHIHGVQCHPEKSHRSGVQLLKNFVEL